MPLYTYECAKHGEFSEWASLDAFDKACPCPACGKLATRTVSAAYLGMDSNLRKGLQSSEKSAHEPRVVRRRRGDSMGGHDAHRDLAQVRVHRHGHSHGGHSHEGRQTTVRSNHPWLVRH
jgi:putative FmdB family regulatory protein